VADKISRARALIRMAVVSNGSRLKTGVGPTRTARLRGSRFYTYAHFLTNASVTKQCECVGMDDAEIKRLKREIHRTYGSSPHKKVWMALLEMHAGKDIGERKPRRKVTADETTGRVPMGFRKPDAPLALHTIRR
jgi:hypothetical protein